MSVFRAVVRTLQENGQDMMAPGVIIWRDHNVDIRNRSIVIVESNQKAVVRIQGQIQTVLDAGSHNLNTPNNPVSNFFARLAYGGNVPWTVEVLFRKPSSFCSKKRGCFAVCGAYSVTVSGCLLFSSGRSGKACTGGATQRRVLHCERPCALHVAHNRPSGVSGDQHRFDKRFVRKSAQNKRGCDSGAQANSRELGINLLLSRVMRIEPEDETMRRVIQLNGIGLDLQTALRARLAEIMALRSDPAATNMFLGIPFYPINVLPFGAQLLQTSAQQSAQAQSANTATQTRQKEGSP